MVMVQEVQKDEEESGLSQEELRSARAWEGTKEVKAAREVRFMQGREIDGTDKLQEEGSEMEKWERREERPDQHEEAEEEGGTKRLEVRR